MAQWKFEFLQIVQADLDAQILATDGSGAAADGSGSVPQPPITAAQALDTLVAQISAEEMQLAGHKKICKFLQYHIECQKRGITPPSTVACNSAWKSHVPQHNLGDPSGSSNLLKFLAAAHDRCCRCLHDVLLEDDVGVNDSIQGGPTALELAGRSGKSEAQAFLISMGGMAGITPTRRRVVSVVGPVPPPPSHEPPPSHDYSYHVPRKFNVAKATLPQYQLGFAAQDGCVACVKSMLGDTSRKYDPMSESNSGWVALDWAGFGKVRHNIDTDEVMGVIEAAGGTFSGLDPKSCQPGFGE